MPRKTPLVEVCRIKLEALLHISTIEDIILLKLIFITTIKLLQNL
jgi:hypothetical protein